MKLKRNVKITRKKSRETTFPTEFLEEKKGEENILKTSLLRYNYYTINCTYLKWEIWQDIWTQCTSMEAWSQLRQGIFFLSPHHSSLPSPAQSLQYPSNHHLEWCREIKQSKDIWRTLEIGYQGVKENNSVVENLLLGDKMQMKGEERETAVWTPERIEFLQGGILQVGHRKWKVVCYTCEEDKAI